MRNSLYTICLVAFISNLLWLTPATAQERNGTVSGTVKDSGGLPLQGALVQLDPGGKRGVTDNQGQFRITDVAAGDYTVTVSYVGFAPFTKSITVAAGQTANVDAQVEVASVADQVLVTAQRLQGEAEAINIERTADNIVQVLPARVITSLPNTNIADAVGRLPSVTLERDEGEGKYVQIRGTEPRLSNVTINGIHVPSPEAGVRNIKLDAVPSDIVDRIEVFKTLLPNQEGDAIGGTVNLVTKTPLERPTVDLATQGGYTPIQGGKWLSNASATLGERFGKNKNLGMLFGGTFDHNDRGIDDLEPGQAIGNLNGANFAYINTEDLRTYQYNRSRYGWNLNLDYSFRPGSVIYFRGLYADFHDFGSTYVYTPNSGGLVSHTGDQTTFDNTGNMAYREYIRRPDQGVYSYQTGGTHSLSSTVIIYEFAVSRGHNYTGQDFPTTNFNGPSNVVFNLSETNPQIPKLMPVGANIYDPTTYSLANSSITNYRSVELDYEGGASLARNYSIGKRFSTFELGFLVRHGHKTQNENDQFYNANGSNFLLNQVLGNNSNPTYYDNAFGGYGPMTDYAKIQSLVASNLQSGFTLNLGKSRSRSDAATWGTTEKVYAGYLMDSITFGKLRLVGGLRIEATGTDFTANQINLNNGDYVSTTPVTGNSSYVNLLPSIQATYQIGGNTSLRLSYSRGISRPNFSDTVPSVQVDPNNSPKSLQVGNPNLVPTRANNYDILIEHYFQPLGILQGGFFYKALTDPIYPTVSFVPANDPSGLAGYLRQESINGPSAHIAGVEMAWQQRLSFLPGLLNGIGVAANYSYTTSRVTFPAFFSSAVAGGQGRIDHPGLQRQAPNTWNLGFTYDKRRLSMRFGVSHNDENIYAYGYVHDPTNPNVDKDPILGLKGPLADQYLYAHTQVDVQGSYRMYKGLSFVVAGLNLTNEVFGFYTGSPIYPNQREFYKPTVIFGMRWSSAPVESK